MRAYFAQQLRGGIAQVRSDAVVPFVPHPSSTGTGEAIHGWNITIRHARTDGSTR